MCSSINHAEAQPYAPPAGQPGSTAIPKDTAIILAWATGCTINRGWLDISNSALGLATVGTDTDALGAATSTNIVSLGDGGEAVLTFAAPITNGPGWDFAVFENSFDDAFLEFAFVEVSSDGEHFVRFSATTLVQDTLQVGSFGLTDATQVNNLAGKYRGGYGTPFDLEELASASMLDVSTITHVKIIDVVGSILPAFARYDQYGTAINDPWATPFPSSGFDLDAVAVLHQKPISTAEVSSQDMDIYPNPATNLVNISWNNTLPTGETVEIAIRNLYHATVLQQKIVVAGEYYTLQWHPQDIATAWYFISITTSLGTITKPIYIQTN